MKRLIRKRLRRGTIFLLALLIWCFKPVDVNDNGRMKTKPGTYEIGKHCLEEGYYVVHSISTDKSYYQVSTAKAMDLEHTTAAQIVEEDVRVYLKEGDYIKLNNCVASYQQTRL